MRKEPEVTPEGPWPRVTFHLLFDFVQGAART